MLHLGPHHYFAIVDAQHDVKDPITIVRVFDRLGPDGVRELSRDVAWVRTAVLDRIEAGEVPLRARSITEKQALRIRQRWEKKINYRFSILVRKDDQSEEPIGVIREWDSSTGDAVYEEEYVGRNVQQWLPSNERWESEKGRRDTPLRVVPTDAATVNQFISSLKGW